jgi:hypothetical protein
MLLLRRNPELAELVLILGHLGRRQHRVALADFMLEAVEDLHLLNRHLEQVVRVAAELEIAQAQQHREQQTQVRVAAVKATTILTLDQVDLELSLFDMQIHILTWLQSAAD